MLDPVPPGPFLGPSERLSPPIETRAVFKHPISRSNDDSAKYANPPFANRPYRPNSGVNLNRPFQDNEPATPQPVANQDSPTGVGAVRGSMRANVAPPGEEKLVKELKRDPGVDNPFALAWWIHGRK